MGVKTTVTAGAVGVAVGLVARSLVKQKRGNDGDARHPQGWKAVTILGDAARFAENGYPEPLKRIEDLLEIRLNPAPGDKGFELHARLRAGVDAKAVVGDENPDQTVRVALREAKQMFETGDVLRATPRPHGRRPATVLGAAVDKAENDAKGEGVL